MSSFKKVLLIAGGVGINPLMSMLSFISEGTSVEHTRPQYEKPLEVHMLYSVKDPGASGLSSILFLDRITNIFHDRKRVGNSVGKGSSFQLFLTSSAGNATAGDKPDDVVTGSNGIEIPIQRRRITADDIALLLGKDGGGKDSSIVYVCGVPSMTDEFVEALTSPAGAIRMDHSRVLFEKWW